VQIKQFEFLSFVASGLTLGISTRKKLGIGIFSPYICESFASLTSFLNSKEFLNILLPSVSYSLFTFIVCGDKNQM
jgi:hypothetical protein